MVGTPSIICTTYALFERLIQRALTYALISSALHGSSFSQAVIESVGSGTWGPVPSSIWRIVSGSDSDTLPDANDTLIIRAGHTITPGGLSRNCARLTIDSGGVLLLNNQMNVSINASPGGSVIVNGTLTMSNTGVLNESANSGTRSFTIGRTGKMTLSGTAATPVFDTYSFDPASTVEYTAPGNQNVKSGIQYGNLLLGGGGKKTVAPLPPDTTFQANGKVTVASGVTFDVSTNILFVRFNGDLENNGTLDASIGVVILHMKGSRFTNNGTHLFSTTSLFTRDPLEIYENTIIDGMTSARKWNDIKFIGSTTIAVSMDSVRNVEIVPGATLISNGNLNHNVKGNWKNDGIYDGGSSTVRFVGTSTQTISGSSFHNVVINNPAGATTTGNVSLDASGVLTLVNGNLNTGSSTLFINSPDTAALAPGTNLITGRISRTVGSGSTGRYLFFDANSFVAPNGTNNPTTITASAFPGVNPPALAPGADTNRIVKRYYTFLQQGATAGFAFTLRLPYLQSEARGNEADYVLWRNGGSGWIEQGMALASPANNYVEESGLTEFSNFTIAERGAALPIQLAYFNAGASTDQQGVHLTWATLSETNNFGFIVQKRIGDSGEFLDVPNSFVAGHGTTLEPQEYSWIHQNVTPGSYYYRLKQIDLDGTTHFTESVIVTVDPLAGVTEQAPREFSLQQNYPNPFNPATRIRFSVKTTGYATLQVFNTIGQIVATPFTGEATAGQYLSVELSGAGLSSGSYFYRLTTDKSTAVRTMLLLK